MIFPLFKKSSSLQGLTAHEFTFLSIDGEKLALSEFRGKAILVVNTATQCGLAKQYRGLQNLYKTYGDRGLIVLGVPSNDFIQERRNEKQIKEICTGIYHVTFPMTEKVSVAGARAHPFYRWAREQDRGSKTRWNFHKYLIGPDGMLVASFGPIIKPESDEVRRAVEALLPEPAGLLDGA